jgi:hypothetical protein
LDEVAWQTALLLLSSDHGQPRWGFFYWLSPCVRVCGNKGKCEPGYFLFICLSHLSFCATFDWIFIIPSFHFWSPLLASEGGIESIEKKPTTT